VYISRRKTTVACREIPDTAGIFFPLSLNFHLVSNAPSARKESVLVVDDHADVCDFIRAALESAGYEVNILEAFGCVRCRAVRINAR
jgi:PleD family two-component response regulator